MMATLSCVDTVKNHEHSASAIVQEDLPLPRKERVNTNKLYDIEVVEEDLENDKVKIHYVGYSSRYDERKCRSEIVIRPPKSKSHAPSPNFSLSTLACAIKKRLTPSRDDPAIRIQLPFKKEDSDLLLQNGVQCDRQYKLEHYSDLSDLLGEDWHYRVVNTRGDFSFVVLETVRFHMYTPKPILEYTTKLMHSKLNYTPVYTEQETQLIFSFVRRDGNHHRLKTFLSQ